MQNKWIKRLLPLLVIAVAVAIAMLMIASRPELPRRVRAIALPLVEVLVAEPGPVDGPSALAAPSPPSPILSWPPRCLAGLSG